MNGVWVLDTVWSETHPVNSVNAVDAMLVSRRLKGGIDVMFVEGSSAISAHIHKQMHKVCTFMSYHRLSSYQHVCVCV